MGEVGVVAKKIFQMSKIWSYLDHIFFEHQFLRLKLLESWGCLVHRFSVTMPNHAKTIQLHGIELGSERTTRNQFLLVFLNIFSWSTYFPLLRTFSNYRIPIFPLHPYRRSRFVARLTCRDLNATDCQVSSVFGSSNSPCCRKNPVRSTIGTINLAMV